MKKLLITLTLFVLSIISTHGQTINIEEKRYSNISDLSPSDTLNRIYKGERYEIGVPCGYVNRRGDTVIPIGKYFYCFHDTVTTYAIVADTGKKFSEIYAIDQDENRLYEVYWFDNGPDYISDGLFRMKRNGKIGYANAEGEIVIQPQFDCASQFENGQATVSYDCEPKNVGENTEMKSDTWIYIDKSGNKMKSGKVLQQRK